MLTQHQTGFDYCIFLLSHLSLFLLSSSPAFSPNLSQLLSFCFAVDSVGLSGRQELKPANSASERQETRQGYRSDDVSEQNGWRRRRIDWTGFEAGREDEEGEEEDEEDERETSSRSQRGRTGEVKEHLPLPAPFSDVPHPHLTSSSPSRNGKPGKNSDR